MTTIETPGICPYCGKKMDLTSDVEGERLPSPGDVTICIGCAGVMVFGEGLIIRKPTETELPSLLINDDVKRMRTAVLMFRKPGSN